MDFEAYLISKKIDSAEFLNAEPDLWKSWQSEFEQMHPNSFTAQKLYLINPVRRKYQLKQEGVKAPAPSVLEDQPVEKQNEPTSSDAAASTTPANPKPVVPRPVFKPKPKMS